MIGSYRMGSEMAKSRRQGHWCRIFDDLESIRELMTSDPFLVPGAGIEPARCITPRDFKSLASTNSATQAKRMIRWVQAKSNTTAFYRQVAELSRIDNVGPFCNWSGIFAYCAIPHDLMLHLIDWNHIRCNRSNGWHVFWLLFEQVRL